MDDHSRQHSVTAVPTPLQAAQAVHAAQRMFSRTLSCWAVDVLALRRAGGLRPMWTRVAPARPWSKAA